MGVGEQVLIETAKWKGTVYKYGGNAKTGIDCSHFVANVMQAAGHGYQYKTVTQIRNDFATVSEKDLKIGDLVLWNAPIHMGIVTDPVFGKFVGAQSSTGVAEANFKTGWWSSRPGKTFRRCPAL